MFLFSVYLPFGQFKLDISGIFSVVCITACLGESFP